MAQGKFSKPRNRFQEPITQEHIQPSVSEPPHGPIQPTESTLSPETDTLAATSQDEELRRIAKEEEAIDHAFMEVTGQVRPSDGDDEEGPEEDIPFFLRNKKFLLIGTCAAALALIILVTCIVVFGRASDPYDGKILNNVTIAGIHVGGLTRSQAENVVRSATEHTFSQQDMVVVLPDATLRFSPQDTGVKLDIKAAVKAAYNYGRTGSKAQQEAAYENSFTGNHTIALLPYLELNKEYILQELQTYSQSFASIYIPATYTMEGEMPELGLEDYDPEVPCQTLLITMGTPGFGLDTEQLFEDILDAYSLNTFQVECKTIDPDAIPEPPNLEEIYNAVSIEPVNASMNQQTFEPIPGSCGYDFDLEEAQRLIDMADYGETVSIPMRYVEPSVQESELFFQDILGYCETPHSNNDNRTHNLILVCELLNGLELKPGEEFSYNGSVGERTAARGFKGAPAYSGTKLVNSIGGGVCQGSSTLYYCALLADMEITDRINHGFPVSYIPYGLDATVNWGGPDFKFRNTSNYPIQIKAEVSDGYMKMWIMGTEERDYYIKLEYEITRIITPEEVEKEVSPDSGYEDGEVIEGGTTGYVVRSYKCKYSTETNKLISRDFVATSSYMTENRVIAKVVGGEEEEEEETEPGESTEPEDSSESSASTESSETTRDTESTENTESSKSTESTESTGSSETTAATNPPTDPPTDPPTQPSTEVTTTATESCGEGTE